jgi:uncharacterized phiE125 gp8 family phage protein
MAVTVTSGPAVEPLTTEEARMQLRVDLDAEDDLIDAAVKAARAYVETNTRRKLITQTVVLTQTGLHGWLLPLPVLPIQSVTSVQYKDPATGALTTWDAANWQIVQSAEPAHIAPAYGLTWPTVRSDFDNVVVTMVAGYGDAATDIPSDLIAAVRLMTAHFFENRQEEYAGTVVSKLSVGADRLIAPHVLHN